MHCSNLATRQTHRKGQACKQHSQSCLQKRGFLRATQHTQQTGWAVCTDKAGELRKRQFWTAGLETCASLCKPDKLQRRLFSSLLRETARQARTGSLNCAEGARQAPRGREAVRVGSLCKERALEKRGWRRGRAEEVREVLGYAGFPWAVFGN